METALRNAYKTLEAYLSAQAAKGDTSSYAALGSLKFIQANAAQATATIEEKIRQVRRETPAPQPTVMLFTLEAVLTRGGRITLRCYKVGGGGAKKIAITTNAWYTNHEDPPAFYISGNAKAVDPAAFLQHMIKHITPFCSPDEKRAAQPDGAAIQNFRRKPAGSCTLRIVADRAHADAKRSRATELAFNTLTAFADCCRALLGSSGDTDAAVIKSRVKYLDLAAAAARPSRKRRRNATVSRDNQAKHFKVV